MAQLKSTMVIGIGTPYRSDDGIGLQIAGQLRKVLPERVEVTTNMGDGFSLIELWQKHDCVYLIDAVSGNQNPGQIYRFDAIMEQISRNLFSRYSTHTINIPETIALAKILGKLPKELIIYGVQGKNFEMRSGLSKEAWQAISRVADCIKIEIENQEHHCRDK
ncbi:MAG: hydrogenase maturation protease [Desulfobacterales bacterium]